MSYYKISSRYNNYGWPGFFGSASGALISDSIRAETLTSEQFAALLSPGAEQHIEAMARRANGLTIRNFGRTIQLYTPLYLSNHCDNKCVYCGFSADNTIERRKLAPDELEAEARAIAATGLRHVLILTGESRSESPVSYIRDCIRSLRRHFTSVTIEVYPLTEEEYAGLVMEGADGITIYQETYDETAYAAVHPSGPKRDYAFRLDAPERAARAGMRTVNIGALFGLADWRGEVFLAGLHARYLQEKFPEAETGISIPRLQPHEGHFAPSVRVTDMNLVQAVTALRIFLPRLSITVSTRESARFRENILPLGVTRMSAGSTTRVGGRTIRADRADGAIGQFEISDHRDVAGIKEMLEKRGYQPVMKDWVCM